MSTFVDRGIHLIPLLFLGLWAGFEPATKPVSAIQRRPCRTPLWQTAGVAVGNAGSPRAL